MLAAVAAAAAAAVVAEIGQPERTYRGSGLLLLLLLQDKTH